MSRNGTAAGASDRAPRREVWNEANSTGAPRAVNRRGRSIELVRGDGVQVARVRWLWSRRIALAKLTLLYGQPGRGKSFLTLDVAARVSRGMDWPDGAPNDGGPGGALVLSAEDGIADTLVPRLHAAGADLSRVHFPELRRSDGEAGHFDLFEDAELIERAAADVGQCRLVVIDPVTAYLPRRTDSHKTADVREALGPLTRVAERLGAAILLVTHTNKAVGQAAIDRATGSTAFVAAPRAAYVVADDPRDPERRLMLPVKNNLGDDRTGMAFRLASVGDVARVDWEPRPVLDRADDALAPRRRGPTPEVVADAGAWLSVQLAGGPRAASELLAAGRAAGHTKPALRKALRALGGQSRKPTFERGWEWGLPKAFHSPETSAPSHSGAIRPKARAVSEGSDAKMCAADDGPDNPPFHLREVDAEAAEGEPIYDEPE